MPSARCSVGSRSRSIDPHRSYLRREVFPLADHVTGLERLLDPISDTAA